MKAICVAVMAAVSAGSAAADDVPWAAGSVLDAGAAGACGVAIGDINRDGKPDVVAISLSDNTLAWYENNGNGGFVRREISADMRSPQKLRLADVDGDGWLDIVVTCAADGAVRVVFNDKTPSNGGWVSNPWVTGQGLVKALAVADLDHDGDLDIVFSVPGSARLAWLENDGTPRSGPATARNLTAGAGDVVNDLEAVDVNRDGWVDVIAANGAGGTSGSGLVWWANDKSPASGGWTRTVVSNGQASAFQCLAVADVNGDRYPDLVAGRLDGTVLWYRSTGAGAFVTATLGTAVPDPRSIAIADVDGDSTADVAVTSFSGDVVKWFDNSGGLIPTFASRILASGQDGAMGVALGDIDVDGDTDAVVANFAAGNVVRLANTKVHSSSRFEPSQVLNVEVQSGIDAFEDLWAVDIDNDGDIDLLRVAYSNSDHAQVWYENDGTPFSGAWTKRIISDFDAENGAQMTLVDAEGDGDLDIGSNHASLGFDERQGFALNDGSPANGGWTIEADRISVIGFYFLQGFGDLDGDGYVDFMSNHYDIIGDRSDFYWTRFDPEATVKWDREPIDTPATSGVVSQMAAADLDLDGDADILVLGPGAACAWLENPGSMSGAFGRHAVSTVAATFNAPVIGDFDGDGRPDFLVFNGVSARVMINQPGSPLTFAPVLVGQAPASENGNNSGPRACDMDRDGDLDIIYGGNLNHVTQVVVSECTDRDGQVYASRSLPATAGKGCVVDFADLDRDGLADIVGFAADDTAQRARMFIIRNRGGQVGVSGSSSVPAGVGLYDGEENALLRLDVDHLGRAGDHAAELTTVSVKFELQPGVALTPTEVRQLVTSVAVFRDVDGDGQLTPGVDVQLGRAAVNAHSATNPVVVTIADGQAAAQVPAAGSRGFLVTAMLTPFAHSVATNAFMASVEINEDSGAMGIAFEDAAADLPLRVAHSSQIIRTGLIQALCPADFNGDGFLDFFDVDAYTQCFEGSGCPERQDGDFNGDGFIDFFDVDEYTLAFEAGC